MIRRAPLLTAALLLALVKSIQFAIDSRALFDFDSGSFILNAAGLDFVPHRSYLYGFLIRVFAMPFHSLRAIVAMQMIMGAITAWLLVFALLRFFQVRAWIAILTGVVFACDPVQVVYDHMVMTENAALLAIALFLVTALQYLRDLRARWLIVFPLFGILVAGLRIVYLPVVLAAAVLLPIGAWLSSVRRPRVLAMALAVSCGCTLLFHTGYRHLTGRLAGREPAYHYWTGFFLVSSVAPLVTPEDGGEPRIAEIIQAQSRTRFPLFDRGLRAGQMWDADGFVARLRTVFPGDQRAADQAAQRIARSAIRRNPIGFIRLGLLSYRDYWRGLRYLKRYPPWDGFGGRPTVVPSDAREISSRFGADVSNQHTWMTPSRRYHVLGRFWYFFLLASPFLVLVAMWLRRINTKPLTVLFVFDCLTFAALCFGGAESIPRYLHPLSFTGLAAIAVLSEALARHCETNPRTG
jgi:hypothetical protein